MVQCDAPHCSRIAERYLAPTDLGWFHLGKEEGMRVFAKGFAALTAVTLLGTPALRAQGAEFALGGGIGIPLGAFDDAVKMGRLSSIANVHVTCFTKFAGRASITHYYNLHGAHFRRKELRDWAVPAALPQFH